MLNATAIRILWFLGLWLAGVGVMLIIAFVIRLALY